MGRIGGRKGLAVCSRGPSSRSLADYVEPRYVLKILAVVGHERSRMPFGRCSDPEIVGFDITIRTIRVLKGALCAQRLEKRGVVRNDHYRLQTFFKLLQTCFGPLPSRNLSHIT